MTICAVLGANSFAGGYFVSEALKNGMQVIGINRTPEQSPIFLPYKSLPIDVQKNYEFHALDLNQHLEKIMALLSSRLVEYVVDFAGQGMVAESWQAPEQWYQTNLVSKVKLHQKLLTLPTLKKYLRASTPEVYGSQNELSKESDVYRPSTPYAVSHAAIDMSLKCFYEQHGFPVVLTRFSNFYGPGQQLYRIIPRTIIYALTGRTLELHGGGVAERAFIHGHDVATGLLACLSEAEAGSLYHFSGNDFVTIRMLVEKICSLMEVSFEELVTVGPERPGKDARYLMDDTKAQTELNWQVNRSLDEGILETIEWVKTNLPTINQLPLVYQHKV